LESLSRFLEEALLRYRVEKDDASRLASQPNQPDAGGQVGLAPIQDRFAYQQIPPELDAAWREAEQALSEGQVVRGIVTGWNRGGILVRWSTLQGFVPASQLKEVPVFQDDDSRDEQLARWVGEQLDLKVIELDRSRNRLVFSERATLWGPRDGERLLAEIEADQTRRGRVSNLCDFGAFIDLGGVDGLIHLSELSWGRVSHPRELLSIGQEVEIYVISVDRENHRIALSLKRLQSDPWTVVREKYYVGQVISPGDEVHVRILRIDSANHRLGLSMRQSVDQEFPNPGPEVPPMESDWGGQLNSLY